MLQQCNVANSAYACKLARVELDTSRNTGSANNLGIIIFTYIKYSSNMAYYVLFTANVGLELGG